MELRELHVLEYRPSTDRPSLETRPAVRVIAGVLAVAMATSVCALVGQIVKAGAWGAWPFLFLAAGLLVGVLPVAQVAATGRSFMTRRRL
jgi:hypothetical protein